MIVQSDGAPMTSTVRVILHALCVSVVLAFAGTRLAVCQGWSGAPPENSSATAEAGPAAAPDLSAASGSLDDAPAEDKPALRIDLYAQLDLEFSDNPFHLSTKNRDRLAANDSASQTSGRFDDMNSVADLVATASMELVFKGDGIDGRNYDFGAELAGDISTLNIRRSHFRPQLEFHHDTGHGGRMGIVADLALREFRKNYLADAVDGNADDVIDRDERVYEPGIATTWSIGLEWRFRFAEFKAEERAGFFIHLGLGVQQRIHDDPFSNRDWVALLVPLQFEFEVSTGLDIRVTYNFAYRINDPASRVLILDEPDFNTDFNNDFDTNDKNVRTVQTVDGSLHSHYFGAAVKWSFTRDWWLTLAYELRLRSFISSETFDSRAGRVDIGHVIELDIATDLGNGWDLTLHNRFRAQGSDEADTGLVEAYTEFSVVLKLVWKIF